MSSQSPLLAQAIGLFSRGAYPQAISLLQQAVAAQPAQLAPRLQLAKACLDWAGMQAGVPVTDIDPETLSGEAAHFLQLATSQLQVLATNHASSPQVQGLIAVLHLIHGRHDEAMRHLKKALAKDPRNPELLYNLGYALLEKKRFAEAASQFGRLTALHPSHGLGWQMLGQAQRFSGAVQASLASYRKASALLPDWYQPHGAISSALRELGRYDEAKEALRAGLSCHPRHRELGFALATLALATGDWSTGWRYYPCRANRSECDPFPEGFVFPLQKEGPVRVHLDQGLGDELFFLRFAPALAAEEGMSIHYTTKPKLFPLLQGMPCFTGISQREPEQPIAYDVLVGDLAYLAGMHSTSDIPPPLALPLDSVKVERLSGQLQAFGPPPYLGLTWQGGRTEEEKKKGGWELLLHKEVPPAMLGEVARSWPGTVVVMQRVPKPEDVVAFSQALGRPWLDWSGLNDDLQEALAGLSLLDEYVGVSNTNMHLLAGIGKTARVLVPYPAEWRWMLEGEESPWFSGFRIYRQDQSRNWAKALQALDPDM